MKYILKYVYKHSTVLLLWKFTPPSGPEIAKVAEICSLACLFIC